MRAFAWVLCVAVTAGCSKPAPPPPEPEAAREAPGLGEVMVLVGRRFETAGRAMQANRFELAAFEVGELGELFDGDVPKATPPKEGPTAHLPAMIKTFREKALPDLDRAAASKDKAKFAAAFAGAAATCNACHAASAKAFIQVPAAPGLAVPSLDPLPAPAASGP